MAALTYTVLQPLMTSRLYKNCNVSSRKGNGPTSSETAKSIVPLLFFVYTRQELILPSGILTSRSIRYSVEQARFHYSIIHFFSKDIF